MCPSRAQQKQGCKTDCLPSLSSAQALLRPAGASGSWSLDFAVKDGKQPASRPPRAAAVPSTTQPAAQGTAAAGPQSFDVIRVDRGQSNRGRFEYGVVHVRVGPPGCSPTLDHAVPFAALMASNYHLLRNSLLTPEQLKAKVQTCIEQNIPLLLRQPYKQQQAAAAAGDNPSVPASSAAAAASAAAGVAVAGGGAAAGLSAAAGALAAVAGKQGGGGQPAAHCGADMLSHGEPAIAYGRVDGGASLLPVCYLPGASWPLLFCCWFVPLPFTRHVAVVSVIGFRHALHLHRKLASMPASHPQSLRTFPRLGCNWLQLHLQHLSATSSCMPLRTCLNLHAHLQ